MKRIGTIGAVILGVLLAVGGLARMCAKATVVTSGLPVGGTVVAFHPWHASGADKNTMECPDCKYTTNPAVQVWVNDDAEQNVLAIAANLDKSVKANSNKKLKAFVVYANVNKQPDQTLRPKIADLAARNKLNNVALVVVGSWDKGAVRDNGINPDRRIRNTVYVYKKLIISSKFVNLVADAKGLAALDAAVNRVLE
jgi:hypothetical protein